MEASGIQPVPFQHRVSDPTHALRMNQRITAEILEVATDHVILALDGFPVVAQLTSADQMAELSDQKQAQFIVRDSRGNQLLLQMIPGDSTQTPANTTESALIAKLLSHFGIPMNEGNLILAQQLLEEGLPITPQVLNELKTMLDNIGDWDQRQAEIAVKMMKAGVPLSEGTLELALGEHPGLISALQSLHAALQNLQPGQLPPGQQSALDRVLNYLNQIFSQNTSSEGITPTIQTVISSFGSTLENRLLKFLSDPLSAESDPLLQLAALRSQLQQAGQSKLVSLIDRVLTELQYQGLNNFINPDHSQLEGEWFTIHLPFYLSQQEKQGQHREMKSARLQIAHQQEGKKTVIDPDNTQMKLHFPIAQNQELVIDLVLVRQSLSARVNASDEGLQSHAEQEIPALQAGLEALGYHVHKLECRIHHTDQEAELRAPADITPKTAINVEA